MKKAIYPIVALLTATSLCVTGCKGHSQGEVLANQEVQVDEFVVMSEKTDEVSEKSLIQEGERTTEELLANYEYKAADLWVVKIYNDLKEKEEYYIMTRKKYSYQLNDEKAEEEKTQIFNMIKLEDEELQIDTGSSCSYDTYTSIFDENITVRENVTTVCCWNDVTLCYFSRHLSIGKDFSFQYDHAFAIGIEPIKDFTINYYMDATGKFITDSNYVIEIFLFYDFYGCKIDERFSRDELEPMEEDLNVDNTVSHLNAGYFLIDKGLKKIPKLDINCKVSDRK